MDKIKVAVLGYGHIGKRHAAIVRNHPNFELVAVVDRKKSAAEDVFHFHTLGELKNNTIPLDLISICTPNGLHVEQAREALAYGCHVVVEKPFGLHSESCKKLIALAKTLKKEVFVVKQNRYSPPIVWLKSIVEQGKLGRIIKVDLQCYWNRDKRYYAPENNPDGWRGNAQLDGGILFTQFSHFIDIMYWIFGDIDHIKAHEKNYTHQGVTDFGDTGVAFFDFEQGGMGSFSYSTSVWDKNLGSSITVLGEKGSVRIGGQYMNTIEYCHIEDYSLPELPEANPPNDYGPYKGSAANHHFIYQNVAETLLGKSTATTSAEEGCKVVDIIERIHAAAQR
jgi:UDP-N-acetyl-2-amino-2-deoxyglucuronate dehydrogenase